MKKNKVVLEITDAQDKMVGEIREIYAQGLRSTVEGKQAVVTLFMDSGLTSRQLTANKNRFDVSIEHNGESVNSSCLTDLRQVAKFSKTITNATVRRLVIENQFAISTVLSRTGVILTAIAGHRTAQGKVSIIEGKKAPFQFDVPKTYDELLKVVTKYRKHFQVILNPSDRAISDWKKIWARLSKKSEKQSFVKKLLKTKDFDEMQSLIKAN